MPTISNKMSEGRLPGTGQPEVVGDIEDYRYQQKMNKIEEQKYNASYPQLHKKGDGGIPQTGAGMLLSLYIA